MPGPWSEEQYQQAKGLLADPGLSPENKSALEAKVREHETLKKQVRSEIVPGQNQNAAAPRYASPAVQAAAELRARNRPMLQKPADPNKRPGASRPLEGGDLEPVVYIEDGPAGEAENNRRYAEMFDEAQKNGQTVYRARDMGDDWTSMMMRGAAQLRGSLASGGISAARAGSGGIVDLEAEDPRAREITSQHPLSSLLGGLGGAVFGLPGRIVRTLGAATPAASVAGRIVQGASSGAKAAALEGGIEGGARLGRGEDPEAVARRIALTLGLGAGAGGLVSGLREGGRAVREGVEQSKRGVDIKRLADATGGKPTTVFGGVNKPPSVARDLAEQSRTGERASTASALRATGLAMDQVADVRASAREALSERADVMRDLYEELDALGLGGVEKIDPGNAKQLNTVLSVVSKYGEPGSEVTDQVLGGIAARNPNLANRLQGILQSRFASQRAVPEAQRTMGERMGKAYQRIGAEADAYRASPEGLDPKSSGPIVDKMQQILARDEADGGRIPFESSSRLRAELQKLLRGADDGESAMVDPEGHVTMGRPANLNAEQLDRLIHNLDEVAKAGSHVKAQGTGELGELGATARSVRDQFTKDGVQGGYSAMRSEHAKALSEIESQLSALGLPEKLKKVDPSDLKQTEAVYQALQRYGEPGSEMRSGLIDQLSKDNPKLAAALRSKLSGRRSAQEAASETLRSLSELSDAATKGAAKSDATYGKARDLFGGLGIPEGSITKPYESNEQEIYRAILKYGTKGNEVADRTLNELAANDPDLLRELREKLVMDAYLATGVEGGVGATAGQSGLRAFLTGGQRRAQNAGHAIGRNLERSNPTRAAATINPILGPLEGLFQRKPEEKRP